MDYFCHIIFGATQFNLSSLELENDYVSLWITIYPPPFITYPTAEMLVAANSSIIIIMADVQTSYLILTG